MVDRFPQNRADKAYVSYLVYQSLRVLDPLRTGHQAQTWRYLLLCLQHGDEIFPGGSRFAANYASQESHTLGWTPLHFTCYYGKAEYAGVALARGAAANARTTASEDTPLHICARRGERCVEAARVLLAAGADLTAKNSNGRTPLDEATRTGSVGMLHLLLD